MSQLYWDDVKVDDELPPREHMPTTDTAIDFFGRDNPSNPAFSDIEAGKRIGVGGALVPGMLKLAWMTQYVSDWGGTASTMRSIRVAYRRPDVADKGLVYIGRVVDKRDEEGKGVIELEVTIVAEDGQPSVRGNAVVELPKR
ncbi:MAG: MaoC family dehydratase [Dehalococcoidia bacterium]